MNRTIIQSFRLTYACMLAGLLVTGLFGGLAVQASNRTPSPGTSGTFAYTGTLT